jgi:hypothetical protein
LIELEVIASVSPSSSESGLRPRRSMNCSCNSRSLYLPGCGAQDNRASNVFFFNESIECTKHVRTIGSLLGILFEELTKRNDCHDCTKSHYHASPETYAVNVFFKYFTYTHEKVCIFTEELKRTGRRNSECKKCRKE